jgi:hypothetical protein
MDMALRKEIDTDEGARLRGGPNTMLLFAGYHFLDGSDI